MYSRFYVADMVVPKRLLRRMLLRNKGSLTCSTAISLHGVLVVAPGNSTHGDELRKRLDAEKLKRSSGSVRRRYPRRVLLDPLLWQRLEVRDADRHSLVLSWRGLWR